MDLISPQAAARALPLMRSCKYSSEEEEELGKLAMLYTQRENNSLPPNASNNNLSGGRSKQRPGEAQGGPAHMSWSRNDS